MKNIYQPMYLPPTIFEHKFKDDVKWYKNKNGEK